jgi:iron complex outermembrane recepter protein
MILCMRRVVALGLAWPALAVASAPEMDALPEIIVTARRVAEAADRIPLAVDVISAGRIGSDGITGLQTLPQATPGLSFEALWGGSFAAPVLRGQSQPSAAGDNVGIFVDGLYQAGRSAVDVMPLDLERIEVARGPQNTLLGRSTFSGAILYVPREPSSREKVRLQVDLGSKGLAGIEGAWSQRLADSRWLFRAALGHRQSDGSFESASAENLDARSQQGIALSVARESADGDYRPVQISARYQQGRYSLPAGSTLDGIDYNCGGRDSVSGLWSYFCGDVPLVDHVDPSPGIPDSHVKSGQVALRLERPVGAAKLDALLGYYASSADTFRDFDGSTSGLPMGVCTIGLSCQPGGPSLSVTRLTSPNVVSRFLQDTTEWSVEFRLGREAGDGPGWMLGAAAWGTRIDERGAFGVDRENLLASERLTAILAGTPGRVGNQSPLNAAVVPDSRAQQAVNTWAVTLRDGLAAFGLLELPLDQRSHLRLELRAESERQQIDSRMVGFQLDTSADFPTLDFQVVTPRLSIDRRLNEAWYGYASLARGARSGGINTLPGLEPDEQGYEPEYNWTTELGLRYAGEGAVASWNAVLYYIDWSNTQITGVATTPGVTSLITRNTAGITTRGLETQLSLRLGSRLRADLAYSWTDPRFVQGSDDAGSRVFCGLSARPPASNFCDYGPPRTSAFDPTRAVPYIDGLYPARTPRHSGTVSLGMSPIALGAGTVAASVSLAMQQDVYERTINGAFYGARSLLGANLSWSRAQWTVTAWGTNLTDDRYIRAASSRGGMFYPSLPRPLDLLYGEGRRVGLTVAMNLQAE